MEKLVFNINSIFKCYRKFTGDNGHVPPSIRPLQSDGEIYIISNENDILYMNANSEKFWINIKYISEDEFDKIKLDLVDINLLEIFPSIDFTVLDRSLTYNYLGLLRSLEFKLKNGEKIIIEYKEESKYDFDCLVINIITT